MSDAGRLEAIASAVKAAQTGAANLGALLEKTMPWLAMPAEEVARTRRRVSGEPFPADLGGGGALVWQDVALFACASARPPVVSIGGSAGLAMAPVAGTSYWFRVEKIERGCTHSYRYGIDDVWGRTQDCAGYLPHSYDLPGVRSGTLSEKRTVSSKIYPGASTEYWVYVNHGIDETQGAPLLVWHDGYFYVEPWHLVGTRAQIVTDNLVHLSLLPPMAHVFVSPSSPGEDIPSHFEGEMTDMRALQYTTLSTRYGRHLVEEVLPDAADVVKLRRDAYSRGSVGISNSGVCAFKLAWLQPDHFSRVHATVGNFTGVEWDRESQRYRWTNLAATVLHEPRRNIRMWMSSGTNDLRGGGCG